MCNMVSADQTTLNENVYFSQSYNIDHSMFHPIQRRLASDDFKSTYVQHSLSQYPQTTIYDKTADFQAYHYPICFPQSTVEPQCTVSNNFNPRLGVSNKSVPNDIANAALITQWDVNDPKLPKIRQYDPFTLWPQGHCRYAYKKTTSEGARRHASGWAMRNTNNHNSQILKKSCLGVLVCDSKNCTLAMRPAICDKARRRQEGRPCCMPNCTGRIYIQPCRGHGGYPVTHFWREHGDTVYFQAKGTHDHVKPDLKPVRDTAARRRKQMQDQSGALLSIHNGKMKSALFANGTRKRHMSVLSNESSIKRNCVRQSDFKVKNDEFVGCDNDSYKLCPLITTCSTSVFPNSKSSSYKEPIFPELHEDYKPETYSSQTMSTSPINLDCKSSNTTYYNLSNPFNYYHSYYANNPTTYLNPLNNNNNHNNALVSQAYNSYLTTLHQENNFTTVTSESAGLNASWSSPSPPTNGSLSMFNDHKSINESNIFSNESDPVCARNKLIQSPGFVQTPLASANPSPLSKLPTSQWTDEGFLTGSFETQNSLNLNGYQMAHCDEDLCRAKSTSNSTSFMSSSTPVSNANYYQQVHDASNMSMYHGDAINKLFQSVSPCVSNDLQLPNRHQTASIPFYLHSSDSSHTDSSSTSRTSGIHSGI